MAEEEAVRSEKIKRQVQLKIDAIGRLASEVKRKRSNIVKFHQRNASEEAARMTERMSSINARMENHVLRAKEALLARK